MNKEKHQVCQVSTMQKYTSVKENELDFEAQVKNWGIYTYGYNRAQNINFQIENYLNSFTYIYI